MGWSVLMRNSSGKRGWCERKDGLHGLKGGLEQCIYVIMDS